MPTAAAAAAASAAELGGDLVVGCVRKKAKLTVKSYRCHEHGVEISAG